MLLSHCKIMQKNKTNQSILNIIQESRKNTNLQNSEIEAILSFVIQKSKEFLYTYPEKKISLKEYNLYQRLVQKRENNTPLAYILGEKEFYNLNFKVNKNVLIPRPETELIIDEVLKIKEINKDKSVNIIDIGTGSGCIIVTLAKLITNKMNFFGLDIDKKALKIAKENSILNNVDTKINFIYSDLFSFFTKNKDKLASINIITANLPYLTNKEFKAEKSIQEEPVKALIASKNGLYYYEKLFDEIKYAMDTYGRYYLFCEINPHQKKEIILMIKKCFPLAMVAIIKDLKRMDRLVKIIIKKTES